MVISVTEDRTLDQEKFPKRLEPGGKELKYYSLSNGILSNHVTNYGARMLDLTFPRGVGKGQWASILLKKGSIADYVKDDSELGSLAVSRWGNRITGACYKDPSTGQTVHLDKNWLEEHYLHGELEKRWSKRIWDVKEVGKDYLELFLVSEDGDFGFPGQVDVTLRISITANNEIVLDYKGEVSGKASPVNIVEHAYFDLSGRQGKLGIKDNTMWHNCPEYLVVDEKTLLPLTGETKSVKGTHLDFYKNEKVIGEAVVKIDNCLVCPTKENGIVRYYSPWSDIVWEIKTDRPCIQVYASKHRGCDSLCAEGEEPVDIMNHQTLVDRFGTPFVKPGEVYTQRTVFRFFNRN